jgi:peptidoglycan/xylan/chitin deacetylase (PgdA/CDA1 family)
MLTGAASLALNLVCRAQFCGVIINEHTLTPNETRRHVEALSRHFEFIHPQDLSSRLKTPSKRRFCLLTFDDGKKSNATQAAPELHRMGIPALFFVTTGFLDRGGPLWFDRYTALIKALGYVPEGLERETLKRLPFDVLAGRLDQTTHELGKIAQSDSEDVRPMSWDEARRLNQLGFSIGAHGVRHAILPRENREVAMAEIVESMGRVTAETGSVCSAFAFPNGNHTAELAEHAMKAGARIVVTTDPAWVKTHDQLCRLPRIQIRGADSAAKIMTKISLAAAEGVLANPDGTGRSYFFARRMSRCTR